MARGLEGAERVFGAAARSRTFGLLGRIGFASQGTAFAIVAVLALALATGHGGAATDPQGAFAVVARHAWGAVLLALLAVGFGGYAAWRFAQALFDRGREGRRPPAIGKRVVQFGQGLVAVGLAASAVRIIVGARNNTRTEAKHAAAGVLGWPGGTWLVVAGGVAVIVVALVNAYWGLSGRFLESLRKSELRANEVWVSALGRVAFVALAVVLAVVGWFLIKAGLDHSANETATFGTALSKLAHATYGRFVLGLIAVGVFAYGVFGFVQARYHDV